MSAEASAVSAAGILLMTRPSDPQSVIRFLLMRHATRWDLPKGHAEPHESLQQTALRETEEETGITAAMITLDPDFRFSMTYPVRYRKHGEREFLKTLHYFLGYVAQPHDVCCTEHIGFEWFLWDPPHAIQARGIDPLLAAVQAYLGSVEKGG